MKRTRDRVLASAVDTRTALVVALTLALGVLLGALVFGGGGGGDRVPRIASQGSHEPDAAGLEPLVDALQALVARLDVQEPVSSAPGERRVLGTDGLSVEIVRLREVLESLGREAPFGEPQRARARSGAVGVGGADADWLAFVADHRALDPRGAAGFLERFSGVESRGWLQIELFETSIPDIVAIFGAPSIARRASDGGTYLRYEFDTPLAAPGLTPDGVDDCEFTFASNGFLRQWDWAEFEPED